MGKTECKTRKAQVDKRRKTAKIVKISVFRPPPVLEGKELAENFFSESCVSEIGEHFLYLHVMANVKFEGSKVWKTSKKRHFYDFWKCDTCAIGAAALNKSARLQVDMHSETRYHILDLKKNFAEKSLSYAKLEPAAQTLGGGGSDPPRSNHRTNRAFKSFSMHKFLECRKML